MSIGRIVWLLDRVDRKIVCIGWLVSKYSGDRKIGRSVSKFSVDWKIGRSTNIVWIGR